MSLIRRVVSSCFRASPLVIGFAALVTGAAYYVAQQVPEVYTATSVVWVGEGEAERIASDVDWIRLGRERHSYQSRDESIRTAALLTSIPVLRQAALTTHLYDRDDFGGGGRLTLTLDKILQSVDELSGLSLAGSDKPGTDGGLQVAALNEPGASRTSSDILLDSIPSEMTEPLPPGVEQQLRAAIKALEATIEVTVDNRSEIATISYSSASPELAALVANAVPRAYSDLVAERTRAETQAAIDWLSERVEEVRAAMVDAEAKLANFKIDHALVSDEAGDEEVGQLGRLVERAEKARSQLAVAEDRLAAARLNIHSGPGESQLFSSAALSGLLQERGVVISRRSELLATLGPSHALVASMDDQLASIDTSIAEEKQRVIDGLEWDVARARENIAQINALRAQEGAAIPVDGMVDEEVESMLRSLSREVETNAATYSDLLGRLNAARQVAQLETDSISFVQRAFPPSEPSGLNPMLLVIAASIGSLGFGFGVVGLRTVLDPRIQSFSQVEAMGVSDIIGGPVIDVSKRGVAFAPANSKRLPPAQRRAQLMFDDAVRRLLAVTALSNQNGPHVILVTSPSSDEGKTTISRELAMVAAASGIATVLVEADLRSKSAWASVAPRQSKGITGVLRGEASLDEVLVQSKDGLPDIVPLTVPVGHSTELLASKRLDALVDDLKGRYQLVIIDSSPVCLTPDAEVLARFADEIVLLVRLGVSIGDRLERALRLLDRADHARLLAFLNGADSVFFKEYYGAGQHLYEPPQEKPSALGRLFAGKRPEPYNGWRRDA